LDPSDVLNEVQLAHNARMTIYVLKLESVVVSGPLAFLLAPLHWIDAFPGPIEKYLQPIIEELKHGAGQTLVPNSDDEPSDRTGVRRRGFAWFANWFRTVSTRHPYAVLAALTVCTIFAAAIMGKHSPLSPLPKSELPMVIES